WPVAGKPILLALLPPEQPPQLRLGAGEDALAVGGELPAAAIDVEGQHRHGRLVGAGLASPAVLGRLLQRAGDALGIAPSEEAALEVERVALLHHPRRPVGATARRSLTLGRWAPRLWLALRRHYQSVRSARGRLPA